MVGAVADEYLPLSKGQSKEDLLGILVPVIFNPEVMPKRVNQTDGEDLVQTSACNFYEKHSHRNCRLKSAISMRMFLRQK